MADTNRASGARKVKMGMGTWTSEGEIFRSNFSQNLIRLLHAWHSQGLHQHLLLRKVNLTGLWAHYNSLSTLSPSAMMVSMDTDVRTQRRTLNYPGITTTRSGAEDVVLQVARPFRKLGVRYSVVYRDGIRKYSELVHPGGPREATQRYVASLLPFVHSTLPNPLSHVLRAPKLVKCRFVAGN